MNDQNDIQTIREIFYRMINDKDLTIEEVRDLSKVGLLAINTHNQELEAIHSTIGRMMTI